MSGPIERGVLETPDGVLTTFTLTEAAVLGSMQPQLQGVSVARGCFNELDALTFELLEAPRAGDQLRLFFEPSAGAGGVGVFDTPIGVIDGVNRDFSTPTFPYAPGEVRIQVNGVTQPPDAVTELDPLLGTFRVDTDFPPDPLRDELIVYWLDPGGGGPGGPVVACPVTVCVEDEPPVVVCSEQGAADQITVVCTAQAADVVTVVVNNDPDEVCADSGDVTVC